MKSPSLFPLAVLLLLAVSLPPTAARTVMMRLVSEGASLDVECGGGGVYAANSTYEANRRRLAGVLLAEAASDSYYYTDRAVGYWPNRPQAISFCSRRGVDRTGHGSSCAACLAGAFLELERACPHHREASFYSSNCTLELSEFSIFTGTDSIFGNILEQAWASGLIFQAIGFGWLFFLLLQEWRSRKRGTLLTHSAPLLSGDEHQMPA